MRMLASVSRLSTDKSAKADSGREEREENTKEKKRNRGGIVSRVTACEEERRVNGLGIRGKGKGGKESEQVVQG